MIGTVTMRTNVATMTITATNAVSATCDTLSPVAHHQHFINTIIIVVFINYCSIFITSVLTPRYGITKMAKGKK